MKAPTEPSTNFFFFNTSFIPCRKFGSPYLGKTTAAARAELPKFLTVRVVFSCVLTKAWLPVLGIFGVHTGINACDCTPGEGGGGCMDTIRECTESWLLEKNPLPHQGIEPASDMWQSNRATSPSHLLPIFIHDSIAFIDFKVTLAS